jgi:O-antigen ligase
VSSQRPKINKTLKAPASPQRRKGPAKWTLESSHPGLGTLSMPWGLADGLGLILGISMVVWWPWPSSTTSLLALTILSVGSFACLPWLIRRWRWGLRPQGIGWVPVGAASGLVFWSVVSMIFSRAPWPVSLYGWEGRQDGVLALVGVAIILAAAASLKPTEIERLFTWLLLGGSVLVLEAMLQLAGWEGFRTSEIEGVWAAMANPNFLAAMCGMLGALALARVCDRRYAVSQRIATGVLLVGLMATSLLTMSAQGPATLLVAFGAVFALRLLQWRGPQRIWVAASLGAVTVVGVGLTVLGLVGIGPVTRVWDSQESTAFRKSFWDVGWRVMEALPLFGTGPGGLSRYVGEYRSEQYVREQGPDVYIDAAHNVPIQYGATMGVIALVFAVVLLGSALVVALTVSWRAQADRWIIAAAGSMLAVYVAQSLISIDELRLKVMGWVAIGVVVALARSRRHPETVPEVDGQQRWLSPVLGIVGAFACVPVLWAIAQQASVTSLEGAEAVATNPVLSCDRRMSIVSSIAEVADLKTTWRTAEVVTALDARCPHLAASYSELALLAEDPESSLSLAEDAIRQDPLASRSWLAYAAILERVGDTDGATGALAVGDNLRRLWPIPDWESTKARINGG